MEKIDCVVVGAGVIGLAVAREMAHKGRGVVVLDAADTIGTGNSSRNSEVIHAGIHYPSESMKARFCVSGKQALYAYCESRGIAYRRCGKLIVATDQSQTMKLEKIKLQAQANGVDDLHWLSAKEAMALEPNLQCVSALMSPSTGIVDSHSLMLSLRADAEHDGAMFVFRSAMEAGAITSHGIEIQVHGQRWLANTVINCAGLAAPAVAATIRGLPPRFVPQIFYAKGNYFSCSKHAGFSHLIYPVPDDAGLGVHLTLDLAGQARFGPDVEWIDKVNYQVDDCRADAFYNEIRKYWPQLPDDSLHADYCGIRPKLNKCGDASLDFRIDDACVHGIVGLVNLFGIESPGLTSALAIASHVAHIAKI